MAATMPACRAIVAARLHAPEHVRGAPAAPARASLLGAAARRATPRSRARPARPDSIPPSSNAGPRSRRPSASCARTWPLARRPMPAAQRARPQARQLVRRAPLHVPVLRDPRLADGVTIAVPGFQPFTVYDVITANLVPGPRAPRRAGVRRRGARLGGHSPGLQGGRRGLRHLAGGRARGARPGGATRSTWASTASGRSTGIRTERRDRPHRTGRGPAARRRGHRGADAGRVGREPSPPGRLDRRPGLGAGVRARGSRWRAGR